MLTKESGNTFGNLFRGIFLFVIGLLGICVIGDVNREIFNAIVFDSLSQKLLLLVPIPVGFAFIYSGIEIINNEKKLITKKNSDYLKQYEDKNELFIIRSEQFKQSHKVASQEYALTLQKYKAETDNQITQMNNILTDLDNRKNSLYSLNIIYPKYRNLVAISSLFEYFESGRCSSLEGADGAYNMYEYELRSNIIINSLSQIIEDLGKIKNNQYALYETIQESNQTVSDLLKNINNTQTLTAYYAKTAAIAASADRYVTAIMH